jgi:glutaredoxin
MSRQQLTLFGRLECQLCQDMLNDLETLKDELGFELQYVDIDQDKQLVELYGTLVPVLMAAEQEICHYFLDKQALIEYFEQG